MQYNNTKTQLRLDSQANPYTLNSKHIGIPSFWKMSIRSVLNVTGATAIFCIAGTSPALAQVSGTVDVSIELTAACEVSGTPDTSNVDFGEMVFATQTTLFTQVDGAVLSGGNEGIDIICTPGIDAGLIIIGGESDLVRGDANRAMSNGTSYVPYNLYETSTRDTPLENDDRIDIVATGTTQTISLYGRAYGAPMLTADSYTDTVSVSLEF